MKRNYTDYIEKRVNKNKVIQTRVTVELYNKITEISKHEELSISDLVTAILRKFLEEQK